MVGVEVLEESCWRSFCVLGRMLRAALDMTKEEAALSLIAVSGTNALMAPRGAEHAMGHGRAVMRPIARRHPSSTGPHGVLISRHRKHYELL